MTNDEKWLELVMIVREIARDFEEHTHCIRGTSTIGPRGVRDGKYVDRVDGLIERYADAEPMTPDPAP